MDEGIKSRIDEMVQGNRIMLFMKGSKMFPQCGFSHTVVEVLKMHNVPFETFNVLHDPEVRQGIKEYSNWPTIPQLYVNGEFIGGCDIIRELHETGELDKTLATEPAQ